MYVCMYIHIHYRAYRCMYMYLYASRCMHVCTVDHRQPEEPRAGRLSGPQLRRQPPFNNDNNDNNNNNNTNNNDDSNTNNTKQ